MGRRAGSKTRSLTDWLEERLNLTEMFSFLTNFVLFPAELDTRRPLREAVSEALSRPMPSYARWPRVLGILSVLLFLFLGVTGVMLAFYYQPTPSEAYDSVTAIVRDVSFGWFVHQIHGWAADAFLLVLLVRGWRLYFQGLYKPPRELLWMVAVVTFLAATHADLTGRLLGWNTAGYWSSVRAVDMLYSLPFLGPMFSFVVGGHHVDSLVLLRFYFLHVAVLPGLLCALFFLHFSGVRRVGLSHAPQDRPSGPGLFRVYLFNLLILTVLVFGTLVTLATIVPEAFHSVADPFSTPPGARAPWYLLASHGFLESFPAFVPRWLRGLLLESILAVSILLPFIDRSQGRTARQRRLAILAGLVVLVLWLLFTWIGYRMEMVP
jgi:quinol-cytochrome oxidoreductase complex cytochrome b subunit